MSGRVLIDGEAAGDPLLYASNQRRSRVAPLRRDVRRRRHAVPARPAPPRRGGARSRRGPPRSRRVRRSRSPQLRAIVAPGAGRRSRRCSWTSRASPGSATSCATRRCGAPASTPPVRPTTLADDEVKRLHRAIRDTLRILGRRGGSHTGDLTSARGPGAALPEGRRAAAAPHGRRPHHLLVPGPPASEPDAANDLRSRRRIAA